MTIRRTAQQWQQLIDDCNDFHGINDEFCRHHNISITSFYKHQASGVSNSSLSDRLLEIDIRLQHLAEEKEPLLNERNSNLAQQKSSSPNTLANTPELRG